MQNLFKRFSGKLSLSGLLISLLPSLGYSEPVKLELYTEEFPPLQIMVSDESRGYVIDFVRLVVEAAANEFPMEIGSVHFVPWKRAMSMGETQENALLFSILRTEAREENYQWIGTVSPYETALYRHKDGPALVPNQLIDLKPYRIGTQAGSAVEDLLKQNWFPDITTVTYSRRLIKMLSAHRIDYAPLVTSSFYYRMEEYGYNPNDFVQVLELDAIAHQLWLVTSHKTSPDVVKALRQALNRLKDTGVLANLIKSYQPDSSLMLQYRAQKLK